MAEEDKKESQENKDLERKFERLFNVFALVGGTKSKIKEPSIIKWFNDAEIIGDKFGIDEDAVKEACQKADKDEKGMELERFDKFVEDIAEENEKDVKDIKQELVALEKVKVELPEIPPGTDPHTYRDELFNLLFDVYSTMSDKKDALQLEQVKKWLKDAGITGGALRWITCKSVGEDSVTKCYEKVDEKKKGISRGQFKEFIETVAREKKLESAKLVDDLVKVKTVEVDMPKPVAEIEKEKQKEKEKKEKEKEKEKEEKEKEKEKEEKEKEKDK